MNSSSTNAATVIQPEFMSPRQLASRWNIAEKTLERWRKLGSGPMYLKLGGRVLYRVSDVGVHEIERTRQRTTTEVA